MNEKFVFTTPSGEKVYVLDLLEVNRYYSAYYAILNNKHVIIEFSNVPTSWTWSIVEA